VRRILGGLFALFLIIGMALPVFAVIPAPDNVEIISARAFTDLAESGDVSVIVHWNLEYDDYVSANYTENLEPASLTIQVGLLSVDGTTVLSATAPYVYAPFGTNGYGHGVSAFYFSAADNLTTGEAYQVRILQSATYFGSANSTSYTMTNFDWQDTTQEDMQAHILQLSDLLLAEYPLVNLKTSTDVGIVLSTFGESYYRAAVPGIQSLCPQLFYVQDYAPEATPRPTFNTDLQDTYSLRMQGSEIKRGADRLGAHLGLSGYFMLGFGVLAACIGTGVWTMKRGWGLEPGMVGASIIAIAGAVLLGNAVFTIVMIGSLIAVLAIMFTFIGRRA
jgi:hypothetical protein